MKPLPADLDLFIAQRIRLVQAGDTTPIDLRRSNGEVIRVQCTVLPNGGRLLTYTLVTDIVRHADELEVLRSALDNIQDGVLLLDADLNAQFLNRKMREYWGVTEQQAAAHPAYPRMIAKALNAGQDAAVAPGQLCEFFSEQDAVATSRTPAHAMCEFRMAGTSGYIAPNCRMAAGCSPIAT